jgi:hypothetical protein
VLLVATALGCAIPASQRTRPQPRPAADPRPAPAGGTSALDDLLLKDLVQDRAFRWSDGRRLTWDDFQGSPPTEGREGAKTFYSLYTVWRCRGNAFEFRVMAGFRPRQSWVKRAVLDDPEQRQTVLAHEQTHFDIGELHARNMRQVFAHLAGACRKTDADLGAIVDRLAEAEKVEQRRYDAETNHGLLAGPQAEWSQRVRRRLAAPR